MKTDIIIFGGQSNMQGQSERLADEKVTAGALEYKLMSDELVPLSDPIGENLTTSGEEGYAVTPETSISAWLSAHLTGASCYGHTSLVPKFCEAYIKETGRQVVAVHVARGSTEISHWKKGTDGYAIICKKARAAIKKAAEAYEIGRVFFVWLQGESDAIARKTKDYYKESIKALANDLKEDIGIEKFGIIRVGRFTKDARDLEIISAQDEICIENANFLMLTDIATTLNEIAEYMNPYVGGHYSASGLQKLGSEAGKVLGAYALNNN